jgi:hypothetical protein
MGVFFWSAKILNNAMNVKLYFNKLVGVEP